MVAAVVLVTWGPPAAAQSGGGYDITWSTVDGGGATGSTGADYVLHGTISQPDAGVLRGGGYDLYGGFWPAVAGRYEVYLPLAVRSS